MTAATRVPDSPPDHSSVADIDGALIIAEQEELLAGSNVTLDYVINDNGSCTCKLCGEVTQSRTHWYRHKYKVSPAPVSFNNFSD